MARPEGLQLEFDSEDSIKADLLERFTYTGEKQTIVYDTKEFSAVCPFSGLPDYGRLIMTYIPKTHCVELKSLKYYLISYRSVGIYQEAATNRLFQDLHKLLKPRYLKIMTVYNTRGGIDTTCEIEKGRPS